MLLPGRKASEFQTVTKVLKTDKIPLIREEEADPADRDKIVTAEDLLESLGAGSEVYPEGEVAHNDVGSLLKGTEVGGLSSIKILQLALSEPTVLPVYAVANVALSPSAPEHGEVGELVTITLTSQFNQGDAGPLVSQEIRKGSSIVLGEPSSASYTQQTTTVRRALTPITFQAHASHAAGEAKQVQPAGTPDVRPAEIGQPDAPQAANEDLESNIVQLLGHYGIFFGNAPAIPTTTAQVRAMAGFQLTRDGLEFVLETGTSNRIFPVLLPPGYRLVKVLDRETNAELTGQYQPRPFSMQDAGGTAQNYTMCVMEQAIAYTSNHHHLITIARNG
ncbi:hypothetical protein [Hymenobacter fodinae]|uniref:Uncharacterized protein n=1 Tax=Hymenobacter fodinae TaxID=2510796 RepID=A0A4Z0PB96_9BACT|nr:hypothetical protein [Hymenobacter fodinae]TGE08747.1 hypothetical protein EU556_13760 [Hymenobacter fodinae]